MSKRRPAAIGATALLGLVPTAAQAAPPSQKLERTYQKAYEKANRQGADPGRNIVEDGVEKARRDRPASAGELRRSLAILDRMTGAGAASAAAPASHVLEAIAACESGGDPTAVDASGTYRGKYQFDLQTWASVGGSGDPAAAPEAEQDARAATLYAQRGSSPWPTCG